MLKSDDIPILNFRLKLFIFKFNYNFYNNRREFFQEVEHIKAQVTLVCKKNAPPRFGVFKKVLNNKNNLIVKVKFMKK